MTNQNGPSGVAFVARLEERRVFPQVHYLTCDSPDDDVLHAKAAEIGLDRRSFFAGLDACYAFWNGHMPQVVAAGVRVVDQSEWCDVRDRRRARLAEQRRSQ